MIDHCDFTSPADAGLFSRFARGSQGIGSESARLRTISQTVFLACVAAFSIGALGTLPFAKRRLASGRIELASLGPRTGMGANMPLMHRSV